MKQTPLLLAATLLTAALLSGCAATEPPPASSSGSSALTISSEASSRTEPSSAPESKPESQMVSSMEAPTVASGPASSSSVVSSEPAATSASASSETASSVLTVTSDPSSQAPKESAPPVSSEAPPASAEIRWPSDATALDKEYYSNDQYIDETELDAMIADAKAYAENLGMIWSEELTIEPLNCGFENPINTRDGPLNVHGGLLSEADYNYSVMITDPYYVEGEPVCRFKLLKEQFTPGYWLVYFLYG